MICMFTRGQGSTQRYIQQENDVRALNKSLLLLILSILLTCFSIKAFSHSDMNSLKVPVRTSYPANIITVGQAVMYVLAVTDYKLAIGYPASTSAASMAIRPIPPEAIQPKTMPVYQALLLLIGEDSRLVVDTKHRLITFESI
jgi:hypothetical protein